MKERLAPRRLQEWVVWQHAWLSKLTGVGQSSRATHPPASAAPSTANTSAPVAAAGSTETTSPAAARAMFRVIFARLREGMPPRFGLVALGAALLWLGTNWTSFPNGHHGQMFQVIPGLALVFAAMVCCALAGTRVPVRANWRRLYTRWRWLLLVMAVGFTLATVVVLDSAFYTVFKLPVSSAYVNDVISFTHVDAQAVVDGHNPYTDGGGFAAALRAYPTALPTPLRRGVLASSEDYPTRDQIEALVRAYLSSPRALHGELDPDTLHSYPALSFLLYVPFVWAGLPDILLLHVVLYCLLFAWLVWLAPPGRRGWAALAAGACLIGFYSLALDSEVVCITFVLAAWHWRERRWRSAVALGLGCAFKQYCWFFAPFLLLEAAYTRGWREALKRGAIALGTFLVPNAPYLVASPGAWAHSLALPAGSALFPMGIGPISLSTGHLLPYAPSIVYTILELVAFVAMLWLQRRHREALGAGVLVLALVPLLFAFRSPSNYFAFAPWLALYAACMVYSAHSHLNVSAAATSSTAPHTASSRRLPPETA